MRERREKSDIHHRVCFWLLAAENHFSRAFREFKEVTPRHKDAILL